jgi:hypothetical protein
MRTALKLSSDGGDSGGKKYKRGYAGGYGGIWRSLRLAGVWSQAADFVQVRSVAVKMFSHLTDFIKKFYNFFLSIRFSNMMQQ